MFAILKGNITTPGWLYLHRHKGEIKMLHGRLYQLWYRKDIFIKMKQTLTLLLFLLIQLHADAVEQIPALMKPLPLKVKKTQPFTLTGKGDAAAWNHTDWVTLNKLDAGGATNETRFKILYSDKGIYVLFAGDDQHITTEYDTDFTELFLGDVFEVFFHPDPQLPLYFEYEVNALDKELVLLIPNLQGRVGGWLPWNYAGKKKVQKMVWTDGGKATKNASIKAWRAELFFPYEVMHPLIQEAPKKGSTWNANFYRLDYDTGKMIKWAWSPVEKNFHEFKNFGTIVFE